MALLLILAILVFCTHSRKKKLKFLSQKIITVIEDRAFVLFSFEGNQKIILPNFYIIQSIIKK